MPASVPEITVPIGIIIYHCSKTAEPILEVGLTKYLALTVSCTEKNNYWKKYTTSTSDGTLIEKNINDTYCSDISKELIDWNMICTTFKQSTSSTKIKTSKECMNGFFTSKLAGSEFNVSLSCLLCNEVIKQNILCERTNLFRHIGHAYVEQFLNKHMSTSFENSKACKNMKLLAPTLRILH